MEGPVSSVESANSKSLSRYELLILHTAEAREWATYLQHIFESSGKFHKKSILLYSVGPADQLHGYNFEYFQCCKCILLLLTGAFLDMLCEPELLGALHGFLHPPSRVVVLLCGISEDDVLTMSFEDWESWRKLYATDEPAVYVTTVLESIADSRRVEAEHGSRDSATSKTHITVASPVENPTTHETEEVVSEKQNETVLRDDREPVSTGNSVSEEISTPSHLTCLTVQPNRVLCGEQQTLFIIFMQKVDDHLIPKVEFSSEGVAAESVPGTLENEYTISVVAPDMPAGMVSLTMYTNHCCVSLMSVTYYTSMGEVSRYLENATDPVKFLCQAFNLTSNVREVLDTMLTDSLKSRMPATSLQMFGIRQIEEENMAAYQRNEELPTLLHFAAKYGLKKLTTILLQCPGSLQAYSVMNIHGDYPNTLAEKSGFSDLRQFMDDFVETANMLKTHFEDTEECAEVYEPMSAISQDILMKYSGCSEDIYESMMVIDPECAEDLYEVMNAVDENPEEAMLRKFFQAKPHNSVIQEINKGHEGEEDEKEEREDQNDLDHKEEEENPYDICPEDIYDTVEENSTYHPAIQNRPPAPIPRSELGPEPERPVTYISSVFSDIGMSQSNATKMGHRAAQPASDTPTPVYDPYAGMKTPGQRQLISLQERVKVGEITVDEAVQEFKAWQFDHERRSNSIRYQQENLKKLRDSITRRHKEREKTGQVLDYEISAPMQSNLYSSSTITLECGVYEPTPKVVALPPSVSHLIQRGSWKTGSTSSTSSTESNRLSSHSTFSYSSGTEPDGEDISENLPPPPRPLRPSDVAPVNPPPDIPPPRIPPPRIPPPRIPPPRIPPRVPERMPETVHERYISYPTQGLPQRPMHRKNDSAPPKPRRLR